MFCCGSGVKFVTLAINNCVKTEKTKEEMKITVLDGYAGNPGDISWSALEALGECTILPRIKAEAFIMHAFEVIGMEPPRNV